MELYLQFGYGMKELTKEFGKAWGSTKVILSPRDIDPARLHNWSIEFEKSNVECLFDPQCYFPKTNHKNLSKYNYWNNSLSTCLGSEDCYEVDLIKKILEYNHTVNAKKFIIPALMLNFDDNWFDTWERQTLKLVSAANSEVDNMKLLLTIALPNGLLMQTEDKIERLIEKITNFDVNGFYIVPEPPAEQYLVENPLWLSNLMQLCAGLKLLNKEVVVGYGNHQMLCLSLAKVDAIASGTYLNVRRFTNKFDDVVNEIKRKSTWYYCPQALSEYKIQFLDLAFSNGIIDTLKPDESMRNEYIKLLFSGLMPSTTSFKETLAFKHYLFCLKEQLKFCSRETYDETLSAYEIMLETSERVIDYLEDNGVFAQSRSFRDIIDVNRSAIQRLDKNRGFNLKYSWSNM